MDLLPGSVPTTDVNEKSSTTTTTEALIASNTTLENANVSQNMLHSSERTASTIATATLQVASTDSPCSTSANETSTNPDVKPQQQYSQGVTVFSQSQSQPRSEAGSHTIAHKTSFNVRGSQANNTIVRKRTRRVSVEIENPHQRPTSLSTEQMTRSASTSDETQSEKTAQATVPTQSVSKPIVRPPPLQRRHNRMFSSGRSFKSRSRSVGRKFKSQSQSKFDDILHDVSGIVAASAFLKRRKAVQDEEDSGKSRGERRLTLTLVDESKLISSAGDSKKPSMLQFPNPPTSPLEKTQKELEQERRRVTAMMTNVSDSPQNKKRVESKGMKDFISRRKKKNAVQPIEPVRGSITRHQTVSDLGLESTLPVRRSRGSFSVAQSSNATSMHPMFQKATTLQELPGYNTERNVEATKLKVKTPNFWVAQSLTGNIVTESSENTEEIGTEIESAKQLPVVGNNSDAIEPTPNMFNELTAANHADPTEHQSTRVLEPDISKLLSDSHKAGDMVTSRKTQSRRKSTFVKLKGFAQRVLPRSKDTQQTNECKLEEEETNSSRKGSSSRSSSISGNIGLVAKMTNIKTVLGGVDYDVREQMRLAGQSINWWIVLPDSKWRIRWDIVMLFLVGYYALMVPFRIAFSGTQPHIEIDEPQELLVDNILTSMFWCDIVLNFFTATKSKGQYIADQATIAKSYATSWFPIDLLATLPIAEVIKAASGTDNSSVAQLNKMLRLLRIFKVLRVFRAARILARFEDMLKFNPALMRLLKLMSLIIMSWHWIGCAYWLVADLEDFGVGGPRWSREGGNTWIPPPMIWCTKYALCNETHYDQPEFKGKYHFNPFEGMRECFGITENGNNFQSNQTSLITNSSETLDRDRACPATLRLQYLYAFFWAVMATTGIGDDIRPVSLVEHVVSVFLILTGVLMMAIIFGSTSSTITSLNSSTAEWRNLLLSVDRFLNSHGTSVKLKHRVVNAMKYSHNQHLKGDEALEDLHPTLRLDVAVSMHQANIEKSPIFSAIGDPVAMKALVMCLKPRMFVPGEYAFQAGGVPYEMFVVSEGKFGVYTGQPSPTHPFGNLLAVLGPGQVFGEMALITRNKRNATVRALSHADTYVLHQNDFIDVMLQNHAALVELVSGLLVRAGASANPTRWTRLSNCIAIYRQCVQFHAKVTFVQVVEILAVKSLERRKSTFIKVGNIRNTIESMKERSRGSFKQVSFKVSSFKR